MFKNCLALILVLAIIGIAGGQASAVVNTVTFSGNYEAGGDCYDTMVAKGYPITGGYQLWGYDRAYGGMSYIGASNGPGPYPGTDNFASEGENTRTLIRFDVSSLAGVFVSVESVELRLFQNDTSVTTVSVHRISDANSNWQEGPDTGSYASMTGYWNHTTWNNKLRGLSDSDWAGGAGLTVPGVDYDSVPLATGASNGGGWMSFGLGGDLTGLMTQWSLSSHFESEYDNGRFSELEEFVTIANEGMVLIADDGIQWSSAEGAFSPELVVTYTPIPEPATMSLLAMSGLAVLRRRRK